ncbi:MAG: M2 family metallopeptidase [Alphaproteobacteria bacterium]|nr:M2 family metallopeptidase [Alphaproteobacteria bacterium]
MRHAILFALTGLLTASCAGGDADPEAPKTPYEAFLKEYAAETIPLWARWKDAAWRTHTSVVPGDHTKAQQAVVLYEAWRNKAADPKWVRQSRDLLRDGQGKPPSPVERSALEAISRTARLYPSSDSAILDKIDEKVGLQARFRRRAQPRMAGEVVRADELARRFAATTDTPERKELWRAMIAPAADLKPGFAELRDLRNELAKKGAYNSYMDAQIDVYGMTASEMTELMRSVELTLRPLYQELHTWTREELASRYGFATNQLIPAHYLPAPLGEDWGGLVHVEHLDVDPALQEMGAKQMVRQVEQTFTAIGLPPLPGTFWERSNLYPAPPGAPEGKTQGASTWDIDLMGDVRVLMNARPTNAWMSASYRELAFAHAFHLRFENRVPTAIRMQEPRALMGALGVWADFAATRADRLQKAGLVAEKPDAMLALLKEALTYVPFVQFGAGTVVPFEYQVYAEALAPGQMNSQWWGLLARHQGVFAPETRTERWADFLHVDALTDAPGRYSDFVLSVVLAFQLHEALCAQLGVDPRTADVTSNPRMGELFTQVAVGEGVEDWMAVVEAATGEKPSADAMVRYFDPVYRWLQSQNVGRTPSLPPLR